MAKSFSEKKADYFAALGERGGKANATRDPEHMRRIGKKGGDTLARNRRIRKGLASAAFGGTTIEQIPTALPPSSIANAVQTWTESGASGVFCFTAGPTKGGATGVDRVTGTFTILN